MAKAAKGSEEEAEAPERMIPPIPEDGRSPLDRMSDLTRKVVSVPPDELARAKAREERKRER